jgi:hypothetical protein
MRCESGEFTGWYELDRRGTVLYCRPLKGSGLGNSLPEFVGKDFFDDVMGKDNSESLRRHFRSFVTSERPVESVIFDCAYNDEMIKTRVNMTRGHESDSDHTEGIIILDIRKASDI